jgi:hypothetical protein
MSQNFLEFEFGLKPLISDIQTSAQILTSFPDVLVPLKGSAKDTYRHVFLDVIGGGYRTSTERRLTSADIHVKLGAYVRISNPNVFLANQLGVLDLALPWKLIPFSFVVDWFVNAEQVFSSMTDWYGVDLINPYSMALTKGNYSSSNVGTIVTGSGETDRWWNTSQVQSSLYMTRGKAIPMPSLRIKQFKGVSIERGCQALSLVVSVFGK